MKLEHARDVQSSSLAPIFNASQGTHPFRRIARPDLTGGDTFRNNRTGTDHGAIPDGDPLEDQAVGPDEDIVAEPYGAGCDLLHRSPSADVGVHRMEVVIVDAYIGPDRDVGADNHGGSARDGRERATAMVAHLDPTPIVTEERRRTGPSRHVGFEARLEHHVRAKPNGSPTGDPQDGTATGLEARSVGTTRQPQPELGPEGVPA